MGGEQGHESASLARDLERLESLGLMRLGGGHLRVVESAEGMQGVNHVLATGQARWQNKLLRAHCSPLVLKDGLLYGFDGFIDDVSKNQALLCMDPVKGEVCWRKAEMAGQMILAADKLARFDTCGADT